MDACSLTALLLQRGDEFPQRNNLGGAHDVLTAEAGLSSQMTRGTKGKWGGGREGVVAFATLVPYGASPS
jgi:hypothetical protein